MLNLQIISNIDNLPPPKRFLWKLLIIATSERREREATLIWTVTCVPFGRVGLRTYIYSAFPDAFHTRFFLASDISFPEYIRSTSVSAYGPITRYML